MGLRPSVLCILLLVILHNSTAKDWRSWRGNTRDGQVSGVDWPERLTSSSTGESNLQKLWRVELGPSYSGPIVSEELVFTTETTNKKKEAVCALDRKSGETVWKTHWIGSMKVPFLLRETDHGLDRHLPTTASVFMWLVCVMSWCAWT